jgi:hypothetical protein
MGSKKAEEEDGKKKAEIQKKPTPRKGKRAGFVHFPLPEPSPEEEKKSGEDDQAHQRKTSVELIKVFEGETGEEILDHTLKTLIRLGIHISDFPEEILMELDEEIEHCC